MTFVLFAGNTTMEKHKRHYDFVHLRKKTQEVTTLSVYIRCLSADGGASGANMKWRAQVLTGYKCN